MLEIIQEPLPLKTRILVKISIFLVKRKNGFTKKPSPGQKTLGTIRRRAFY